MPTITISITDAEAAAVLATTRASAQAFLERNARVHVADCVGKTRARRAMDAGLRPAIYEAGLEEDVVEALIKNAEEKKAVEEVVERVAPAPTPARGAIP